jgi:hypothetical protein
MLNINNLEAKKLFAELSPETAANINGGQGGPSGQGGQGGQGEQGGQGGQGEQGGKEDKSKFNYSRYLKALGIAYLSPPGVGTITDKEALLAQYQGWED